jgi:hypothetical protein
MQSQHTRIIAIMTLKDPRSFVYIKTKQVNAILTFLFQACCATLPSLFFSRNISSVFHFTATCLLGIFYFIKGLFLSF